MVCSVNLWPRSGNNKEPEEEEVNENKNKAKGENAGNGAHNTCEGVDQGSG